MKSRQSDKELVRKDLIGVEWINVSQYTGISLKNEERFYSNPVI
jgi:hypothetical protein